MFDLLSLANARLALALNYWLAASPSLYETALQVTGKISDIIVLATFAFLWFWPQPRRRQQLLLYPDMKIPALQMHWLNTISREESRAQLLVLCAAGVLGYVLSQLIALALGVHRPFASFLPVQTTVPEAFEGMLAFDSFPSAQGVMLGAIPIALWFWDRRLAYLWIAISIFLAVTHVAVGFYWPLDMIAGALLGGLLARAALGLYRAKGRFSKPFLTLARGFDLQVAPYCYILYALLLLGIVEFVVDFQHLSEALITMRAEVIGRFARG